ncbi:CRISPR system precrRNA processing endoribonuclease RAMP protein Cas6 [Deferribacter abyssi]|uniref:CRISPR system precrRNA processing endoribonuclease RAMP protein Cas6 n=1 Tax=Deferribacter abyssi TaxID=213806 RepID=UPI003C1D3B74
MIDYVKVKFILEATCDIVLPRYKGSTFRGAFGWQFKKITCVLKSRESCDGCLLRSSCFYFNIFETYVSDKPLLKSGISIPHPYILVPPLEEKRVYEPGSQFEFELIVIGRFVDALPYFVFTFEELGKKGLGKAKGKFIIKDILQNGVTIYQDNKLNFKKETFNLDYSTEKTPKSIEIKTLTPVRLFKKGKPVFQPTFKDFFMAALRRCELLMYYYGSTKLDEILDVKQLIAECGNIEILKPEFNWYHWERYSNRQKRKISLSGIMGSFFITNLHSDLYKILWFGEVFHIGKNTAFGLGKYEIL